MTCDTVGVISPIVQVIAAYQVTQVLQILSGETLSSDSSINRYLEK